MVICSLDALKKSWKKKEARIRKEIVEVLLTLITSFAIAGCFQKVIFKGFYLKVQSCKLKKHCKMIAYMFQKPPENFAFQLFIILQ